MNAPTENGKTAIVSYDEGEFAVYFDTSRFNQAFRVAQMLAQATILPPIYQGNVSNCFIALQAATRMQIDPFLFMQKTYVIGNKLGLEAQLNIALINQRGPFTGPLQWKTAGNGVNRSWTCYATHKVTGEVCERSVTWQEVVAEGWDKRNGSKWLTIPEQMGRYRSATWMGRLYCPEVTLGLPTIDELVDRGYIDPEELATVDERTQRPPIMQPREVVDVASPKAAAPAFGETAQASPPTAPAVESVAAAPEPAPAARAPAAPSAEGQTAAPPAAAPSKPADDWGNVPPPPQGRPVSPAFMKALYAAMTEAKLTEQDFQKKFGWPSKHLTDKTFNAAINWAQGITPAGSNG